jgi:hypothetical protein
MTFSFNPLLKPFYTPPRIETLTGMIMPNKPLPRTALEPVCGALAAVIQQRRTHS